MVFPVERVSKTPEFSVYPVHSENIYLTVYMYFVTQIAQIVIKSWEIFGEAISAQAKESKRVHYRATEEVRRQRGQQREVEFRIAQQFGAQGIERQAGKFRYFEGERQSFDRHLCFPI